MQSGADSRLLQTATLPTNPRLADIGRLQGRSATSCGSRGIDEGRRWYKREVEESWHVADDQPRARIAGHGTATQYQRGTHGHCAQHADRYWRHLEHGVQRRRGKVTLANLRARGMRAGGTQR